MIGPNKVKTVQKKIKSVKGQIKSAVQTANIIFQKALDSVNNAITSILTKKKELLGFKTILSLEVGKIEVKIDSLKKEIVGIEDNYPLIDENMKELEAAVTKLEEQRDKIQEFIVKV
jgi:chromosome segregation ATPase